MTSSDMLGRLIDYILMFYLIYTVIALITIIVAVILDKLDEFKG